MTFFTKNENGQVTVPEGYIQGNGVTTHHTYQITVQKVLVTERPEFEETYINRETGKECARWSLPDEPAEREKYTQVKKATGKIETLETKQEIFDQKKDNLDVADLALYINRAR